MTYHAPLLFLSFLYPSAFLSFPLCAVALSLCLLLLTQHSELRTALKPDNSAIQSSNASPLRHQDGHPPPVPPAAYHQPRRSAPQTCDSLRYTANHSATAPTSVPTWANAALLPASRRRSRALPLSKCRVRLPRQCRPPAQNTVRLCCKQRP